MAIIDVTGIVTTKLKDWFPKMQANDTAINNQVINHVAGSADKHTTSHITNSSSVIGPTATDAINTLNDEIDALVLGASNATIGFYSINGSGTNAITGTFATLARFIGLKISLTIAATNTGAATFNLNSSGAVSIKTIDTLGVKHDLVGGEMTIGSKVLLEDDGTDYIIIANDNYKISRGLFTAANDFVLGASAGTPVKKTLAETQSILGITSHLADKLTAHNPEDPIAPTLLNSWVNYGSGYSTVGYWKDSMGMLHIKGNIKSGVLTSVAFNLPSGYRPSLDLVISVSSNNLFGYMYIRSNGDVVPFSGSNTSFSFDNISFRVGV